MEDSSRSRAGKSNSHAANNTATASAATINAPVKPSVSEKGSGMSVLVVAALFMVAGVGYWFGAASAAFPPPLSSPLPETNALTTTIQYTEQQQAGNEAMPRLSTQRASGGSSRRHYRCDTKCAPTGSKTVWEYFDAPRNADEAYSNHGSTLLGRAIQHLTDKGVAMNSVAVNWGSHDGMALDPLYSFFMAGWSGTCVEARTEQFNQLKVNLPFERVIKINERITPFNAVDLLQTAKIPSDVDIWKCDIDGYDHSIVRAVLQSGKYRPKFILMEINEKIRPPINFATNFHHNYAYAGDHFYGVSLSALQRLLDDYNYRLLFVDWNNVVFANGEYCEYFTDLSYNEKFLYEVGYWNVTNRKEHFPWNVRVEHWITETDDFKAMRAISNYMIGTESYKAGDGTFMLTVNDQKFECDR